jgi:hypothetical protein
MSETRIPAAMRRAVIDGAKHCCEYCGIPEDAVLAPHEPDHVIGEQHGGTTDLENLALACFRCSRFKGPNIATLDPQTSVLIPLYNPRIDRWHEHFRLVEGTIEPISQIGRGTAKLLHFNDEQRVILRAELMRQGRYVPPQS